MRFVFSVVNDVKNGSVDNNHILYVYGIRPFGEYVEKFPSIYCTNQGNAIGGFFDMWKKSLYILRW